SPSPPPTPRQLAYLDELKTRLRELRECQVSFMEQTAQMLNRMSSAEMSEATSRPFDYTVSLDGEVPPKVGGGSRGGAGGAGRVVPRVRSKGDLNIKQLIQRFEDLRKTSQEFEDLPEVPEELIKVDVRRILQGYEKLIDEGSVLQQSWLLLQKTTESCARLVKRNEPKSTDYPTDTVRVLMLPQPEPSPQVVRVSRLRSSKEGEVVGSRKMKKCGYKDADYGHARWGAFMQLILRVLNPF
ncbi:hypothetical protein KR009_004012, partial [Drosophila setifemur]